MQDALDIVLRNPPRAETSRLPALEPESPDMVRSADAPEGFDPYRAWLGVRDPQRPLNAYQLLGLKPFEDNPEAVRIAAGVKRRVLMRQREGAFPDLWERVFTEMEEAISILTDAKAKAAYDTRLRTTGGRPGPARHGAAVPQTGVSGRLRCPVCETPNPANRRFCAQCGKNLWEACFRCGAVGTAEERFCGSCGADLADGIDEELERLEHQLDRARQCLAECRFEEAEALAEPVSRAEHSRLLDLADRAAAMIQQSTTLRAKAAAEADAAYESARQAADARDFQAAQAALEGIAEALRDEKTRKLYEEVRTVADEIESLTAQVDAALAAEPALEMLEPATRLLELQPDHGRAATLAGRLSLAVARKAARRLAAHRYADALKLLDRIPAALRVGRVGELHDHAAHCAWLSRDLRTAPVADPTLLALAGRLAKAQPQDPDILKLFGELGRRAAAPPADGKWVRSWAAPPKQPRLGCPVEWMLAPRRLELDAALDRGLLARHAGRFAVAAGLALQALHQAAVPLDLNPDEPAMLARMARLITRQAARAGWGLDLGQSALKAVRLAVDPKTKALRWDAFDVIEHAKPLGQAVNEDEEQSLIDQSFRTFLERHEVKGCRTCLGLPGSMLLQRHLHPPRVDDEKLARILAYEARSAFPLPLEQLAWAYAVLDQRGGADLEAHRHSDVLLLGAKRLQLKQRISLLDELGLRVDAVQADAIALWNLLAYEYQGEEADDDAKSPSSALGAARAQAVAVLDIGSTATNFVVTSPDLTWIGTTGLGAEHFARAIVRQLHCTLAAAEKLTRNPAEAPNVARLYDALEPVFDELAQTVEGWLAELAKTHRRFRPARILATGGGLLMHGLLRHLQRA